MRLANMAMNVVTKVKSKATAIGVATMALVATSVDAQVVLPELDPIVPPVDISSVTTEVSTFGGSILLAWAGLFIAFGLSYKLVRRLRSTA